MENTQYLLESVSIIRSDLEKIDSEIYQSYFKSKYILRSLILSLYECYRDEECYVPYIKDVDPSLKLSCSRKDVGDILNWIRELLPYLESCDDKNEYIIEYINDDEVGLDMYSKLQCVQEAVRVIEHELKKKCYIVSK